MFEKKWDMILNDQKQPSIDALRQRSFKNMQQVYKRTFMPKCDFNKVVLQLYWNHTWARVSSCKLAAFFQNSFTKNTSGWVLLNDENLLSLSIHLTTMFDSFSSSKRLKTRGFLNFSTGIEGALVKLWNSVRWKKMT